MKVLTVDDDDAFRRFLELGLTDSGDECVAAPDAEQALAALRSVPGGHFDVILLDVEMPGTDGIDLLGELREAGNETPVIFVSGRPDTQTKIAGLGMGADDYVVKPVELDELRARMSAVLRRREGLAPIVFGEVEIDLGRRRVLRRGQPVELTPREYDLLFTLVRAKGETISRQGLLREVWELDFDPETNLLDVHLGRLRRKLDRLGPPLIENVRGEGYRIVARRPETAD